MTITPHAINVSSSARTSQYPNSFADITPGGDIIGGGFILLLMQVETRIENVNCERTSKQHRLSRQSGQETLADSHGYTHFRPELPTGETNETLEQKGQQLENIYRQEGSHGGEKAETINLMTTTYYLQREHMNAAPAPSF